MTTVEGVDVSHHQPAHSCDWTAAARAGLAFAWVKSTEGADYLDPEAKAHMGELARNRTQIMRGLYHFGRPDNRFRESSDGRANGQREGNWAARQAIDLEGVAGCLPLALDLEKYTDKGTVTTAQREDYVRGFIDEYESCTGVLPSLYTGATIWGYQYSTELAQELHARGVLLWLVSYSSSIDPPDEIPGWPWGVWQWSGGGDLEHADPWPGLPTPVDRNVYRGTRAELRALIA